MMNIARVMVDLSLDRPFDYRIPENLVSGIQVGTRVTVPFNHSEREAFVIGLTDRSEFGNLKDILRISPSSAHLPPDLVALGEWMAEYYCCAREQAIRTLLPGAVRNNRVKAKTQTRYFLSNREKALEFLGVNEGRKAFAGRCSVLRVLLDNESVSTEELRNFHRLSVASLKTLQAAELVVSAECPESRSSCTVPSVLREPPLELNAEQQRAMDTVRDMLSGRTGQHVLLLQGVTNSGKTEVYLQSIAATLERGKSAIMLVPEISLTPQTVRRFQARFGEKLSILHSGLSDAQRFEEWHKIRKGEVSIVVGARSAVFAPFRNLGLIVVDEEHESSYKQSEAPRYSARDVAVVRGSREKAAVILGSATPSAESCRNALEGRYLKVVMTRQARAQKPPSMVIVDQRLTPPQPGRSNFFTPDLINAVNERLERSEQTILFLNRRGFARVMLCEKCGFEARCPDCSTSYTYYRKDQRLTCHLCGGTVPAPEACPDCGDGGIRFVGIGTEKVEAAAIATFPSARIARMDSCTMRKAEDYDRTLEDVRCGRVDILIGTQMIAKGLHFPNVTLVGVIQADAGLMMDDFRAGERGFQLLAQVAGRAGRGDVRGEVLIQTYHPDNEVIVYASRLDFESFMQNELEVRKVMAYPPYSHLIAVYFRGKQEECVARVAKQVTEAIRQVDGGSSVNRIAGPCPAPIERIMAKFRYLTIIRGTQLGNIRRYLRCLLLSRSLPAGVEMIVDVDAQSLT